MFQTTVHAVGPENNEYTVFKITVQHTSRRIRRSEVRRLAGEAYDQGASAVYFADNDK